MFTRDRASIGPTASLLTRVEIATPRRSGDLRVWPLVALDAVAPPAGVAHAALAAAIAAGTARVEIPPGRGYRALRANVENHGDAVLLLLAGEPPLATRPRWRIAESLLVAPRSNREIQVRSEPLEDACVAAHIRNLAEPLQREQLGFVVALGEAIAGIELMGRADVFAHARTKVLAPWARAAAAAQSPRRFEATPPAAPEGLLGRAMEARCVAEPGLGVGETLRLAGRGIVGRGLALGGVVQLSVRWLGDDGEPLVKFP